MTRTLFVLGGARSGKSAYAQARCEALGRRLVYIATAEAGDDEMAERIARHRADRGECWSTLEAPLDLPGAIAHAALRADAVLVDCLTLWLSNLMLGGHDPAPARTALALSIEKLQVPLVLIANEVGLGIVPDNALARRFRDEAGRLNQHVAAVAAEVVLMVAGLPVQVKG
ncbi:bifunctional adenosylcobinamide kinase/adenosylcobinamide-phosphate guanylyltransferase [Novosphingobium huizhouense]|uniref:bifunctional adenosylcobinamide kinase/adenosylcobinamide-phosphate guanylyltransferase n=1 Tax=Novosphingobium huizhouense TaxID=2866625 RepID=UPI001CD91551|nr:bifunctional adenosylcobinamide kinase/adenosylcobinamide-phosphate guanylyltransferase [Novosphingobium huizhouense]